MEPQRQAQSQGGKPATSKSGSSFVATVWGRITVIEVYAPPSWHLTTFSKFLDELRIYLTSIHKDPFLVLGDFNAKITAWGSPKTDTSGKAASIDLRLLNTGNPSTVRWQGESIVDLS